MGFSKWGFMDFDGPHGLLYTLKSLFDLSKSILNSSWTVLTLVMTWKTFYNFDIMILHLLDLCFYLVDIRLEY
ncbi:hypothetical protein BpHYR1_038072 [Brachionus plicatilis]|uniref:Uncharacterized protein n=1 Tax=Brachionus plicatilis TaxID=10195 RepID=A0A3M7R5T8_BRAPC|nr:hypothetical protein BpHYR1_038072 [Brachionus plicatilis]